MRAGSHGGEDEVGIVTYIDQQPIGRDMALPMAFIIASERVVAKRIGKRLPVCKHIDNHP